MDAPILEYVSLTRAAELAGLPSWTVRWWIADERLHALRRRPCFSVALVDLSRLVGRPLGPVAATVTARARSRTAQKLGMARSGCDGMTPSVRDLMAELRRATAVAARCRTLADRVVDRLGQVERHMTDSDETPNARESDLTHEAAPDPAQISSSTGLSTGTDGPRAQDTRSESDEKSIGLTEECPAP
jgi:hypothetical protein